MATVYPNANLRQWSDVSNWYNQATSLPYGQLPQPGDTVVINVATIYIDTNINITAMTQGGSSTIVSHINGNRYTITCPTITNLRIISTAPDNTYLTVNGNVIDTMSYNGNRHSNITLNGNVTLTGSTGSTVNYVISNSIVNGNVSITSGTGYSSGANNCIITGNVTSFAYNVQGCYAALNCKIIGTINSASNNIGAYYDSNCNPTYAVIIGNQTTNAIGTKIQNYGNVNLQIYGDLYAGIVSSRNYSSALVENTSSATTTINGSVYVYNVPRATYGVVRNTSTGKIVITGDVFAGTGTNTMAITNESTGEVTINGNLKAGSTTTAYGYYSTTASKLTVLGQVIADGCPAVYSSSQTATNVFRGNIVNKLDLNAIYCFNATICNTCPQVYSMYNGTSTIQYATSNAEPSQPLPRDVKKNIIYGSTNQYTGLMNIPNFDTVLKDVPVDGGVGTLGVNAVWNYPVTDILTTDSIGLYLKNASTVESTAQQLVSLG